MAIKDDKIIAKLPKDEKQELVEYAASIDVPVSQVIREALREKMATVQEPVQTSEAPPSRKRSKA